MDLRPYQQQLIDGVYGYFRRGGRGNPLVVAPTAAGKSVTMAAFIRDIVSRWPNQRVLLLSHVREILLQNEDKIRRMAPELDVGVYQAGLGRRENDHQVVLAGIHSVFRKGQELLGWRDLCIIDEVHAVNHDDEGMYRTLLNDLLAINRRMRVIGFTATPFRLNGGSLLEGHIFDAVAAEVSIQELLRDGYLCPLVTKASRVRIDTAGVAKRSGDFAPGELERAADKEELTHRAISEMEALGEGRKSWLVFCSGVAHAEHFAKALRERGHTAECVTGETDSIFREQYVQHFKAGRLKCLVNCMVYTLGFDAPNVDLLACLRPTLSPGLWIQIVGRAMRLHPLKKDALILDFTDNSERFGPIDAIQMKRARRYEKGEIKEKLEPATLPFTVCDRCTLVFVRPANCLVCPQCGTELPQALKHNAEASDAPILSADVKPPDFGPWEFEVRDVQYARHVKKNAPEGHPPTLRVDYVIARVDGIDVKSVREWVCVEHRGFARSKAERWWRERQTGGWAAGADVPATVDEALARTDELRRPTHVRVHKEKGSDGKLYDRVLGWRVDEDEARRREEAERELEDLGVNI